MDAKELVNMLTKRINRHHAAIEQEAQLLHDISKILSDFENATAGEVNELKGKVLTNLKDPAQASEFIRRLNELTKHMDCPHWNGEVCDLLTPAPVERRDMSTEELIAELEKRRPCSKCFHKVNFSLDTCLYCVYDKKDDNFRPIDKKEAGK